MNDSALPVAVNDSAFGQNKNLKIARREGMFLNSVVDLPCSQSNYPMLPASSGGFKP